MGYESGGHAQVGEDDGSMDVRSVSEKKIPSDELIERLGISVC